MNVCQTSSVQDAWARNQEVTVHGWIYDLKDGQVRDLGISIKNANGASPLDGAFKLVNVQDVKGPDPYADAGVFKAFTATMSYTFQQAGTFVVGVGVTDSIDQIFDSILTVQDFRINGNPLTGVAESAGTVQVNASAPVVEVSALVGSPWLRSTRLALCTNMPPEPQAGS